MTRWQEHAACRGSDPNLWVPAKGDHNYGTLRNVCAECPVIDDCRDYALDHPDLLGLWAGMTTNERHAERRRRQRRGRVAVAG